MSDYRRTTRECNLDQLQPELAHTLQQYFQQHPLSKVEAEILMCCETSSTRTSTNQLDAWLNRDLDTNTTMALLLTPQRLIWALSGERSGIAVASAQLKDLRVKVFAPKGTRDFGLDVYGRMEYTTVRAGGKLFMGPEAAAKQFCEEIGKAMQKLYPPKTKRARPKWLGG
ncbi:MAG TPA: hypothetical protein VII92_14940 [Anaerolineae bacterium]